MRRSKLLLTGAILCTVYLIYLIATGYTLLGGLAAMPEHAYILGRAISFNYLALHALCAALAAVFAWLAFALSLGAAALISLALCAAAGVCAPLLAVFVAPTGALALAGFIGLRKARAARRKEKSKAQSAPVEAVPAPAPAPAPREDEDDRESRADPITIVMTALCVLVVAAIIGVVLYGLLAEKPAQAPNARLDDADDLDDADGEYYAGEDDEYYYGDEDDESYDEDDEGNDEGDGEYDDTQGGDDMAQIDGILSGVGSLIPERR